MNTNSIENLTTSRINRLLRPLRSKCINLSAHSQTNTISQTCTSSSSLQLALSTWDTDGRPPLSIACLAGTGRRNRSHRSTIVDYELIRKIRAVGDAFRNIVYGAFGMPCLDRIPSLAALCGSAIGNNIPVSNSDLLETDSVHESVAQDDIMEIANEIYDSIPPHYRKFSVVSHALSMILRTCGRRQTLVNILLDVCLSFGLVYDARHLLNTVLSQALLPENPFSPPPIMQPAYATYLVDLHSKCTSVCNKQNRPTPFTTAEFCQTVLSTLSHSDEYALFTWDAVIKLVHTVGRQDINVLVRMTGGLAAFLFQMSQRPTLNPESQSVHIRVLRSQLIEWMCHIWDSLADSWGTYGLISDETLLSLIDTMENSQVAGSDDDDKFTMGHTPVKLSDIIAVLATQIFVHLDIFSDRMVSILDGISPTPATYIKLTQHLGRHQPTDDISIFARCFMSQLQLYSSALCSRSLLKLDASLWACALNYFEKTVVDAHGGSVLMSEYRRKLIDAVDAAEQRCFGSKQLDSSPPVRLPGRFKRKTGSHQRKPSGHWEWEEMVGCWIRKTPVQTKRKQYHGNCTTTNDRLSRRLTTEGGHTTRVVDFTFGSRYSITSQSCSQSFARDICRSDTYDSDDKENYSECSLPQHKLPLKKPRTSFITLLADAQANRVVLHGKNYLSSKMPEVCAVAASPASQRHEVHATQPPYRMMLSPKVFEQPTTLPSDDSLDLFAVSSPLK